MTSGRWFRYIAALVVAGLLVYAVVVASGGLRDALHQLRHASQIWLVPALVLEFSSYALAGWLLRMLRGDNDTLTWLTTRARRARHVGIGKPVAGVAR